MNKNIKFLSISLIVLVVFSLFSLPVISVWQKSHVLQMLKTNEKLIQKKNVLINKNMNLISKNENLIKRERIEVIASKELGLIYPNKDNVIFLAKISQTKKNKFFRFF